MSVYRHFRFIPVCTGNTPKSNLKSDFSPVYPCVYREHLQFCKHRLIFGGLSLCVQGTREAATIDRDEQSVYPCVYREHSICVNIKQIFGGLSLCVQGTPRQ